MKDELIEKIVMMWTEQGGNPDGIKEMLYIIMKDYDIERSCTDLVVRQEDRNEFMIKRFIVSKTVKGCSQRTLDYYGKSLKNILDTINMTVDDIRPEDVQLYLAIRMKRDKVSKTTAGNECRILSSFFAYLTMAEIIPKNIMLQVDGVKKPKTRKHAFTEMEVERIRGACRDERDTALIELLLSTGCRISEIAKMKIEDLAGDHVTVNGKGDKDRIVYLNAKAQISVENYLRMRKDKNPYLFPQGIFNPQSRVSGTMHLWWTNPKYVNEDNTSAISGRVSSLGSVVRRIGRKAGVSVCHPHKFRRTCATFALRRGMPVEQVSKMLGHENIGTTQIYLDLDEQTLAQEHQKFVV